MTPIDQIKAEITSIKDLTGVGLNEYDMGHENGVCETCDRLLSFIDSLEKEDKVFKMEATFHTFDNERPYINFDDHKGSIEKPLALFEDGDRVLVQISKLF